MALETASPGEPEVPPPLTGLAGFAAGQVVRQTALFRILSLGFVLILMLLFTAMPGLLVRAAAAFGVDLLADRDAVWIAVLEGLGVLVLTALPAGTVFWIVYSRYIRFRARAQNAFVQSLEDWSEADGRGFANVLLFLRPFFLDGYRSSWLDHVRAKHRLEPALVQATNHSNPLLKIGTLAGHANMVGAVTVPGDRWKTVFRRTAAGARTIIMVPIAQPSTLWELKQIVSAGLLAKTVFVMPVDGRIPTGSFRKRDDVSRVSQAWNKSRAIIKSECGLDLPAYRRGGGLMFPARKPDRVFSRFSGSRWMEASDLRRVLLEHRLAPAVAVTLWRAFVDVPLGAAMMTTALYFFIREYGDDTVGVRESISFAIALAFLILLGWSLFWTQAVWRGLVLVLGSMVLFVAVLALWTLFAQALGLTPDDVPGPDWIRFLAGYFVLAAILSALHTLLRGPSHWRVAMERAA